MGALYHIDKLINKGEISADLLEVCGLTKFIDQSQVTVLEMETEAGGLARSVTDASGFSWDLGVHITTGSTKFPEFLDAIETAVAEWSEIRRSVKVGREGASTERAY
jgi:hypothetical protein